MFCSTNQPVPEAFLASHRAPTVLAEEGALLVAGDAGDRGGAEAQGGGDFAYILSGAGRAAASAPAR
jgi:hypothetical protein